MEPDDTLGVLILFGMLAGLAWIVLWPVRGLLAKRRAGEVTIQSHEVGLRFREGKLETPPLPAGRYFTWPDPVVIERIDMREFSSVVPGQEVLTRDNMAVRATVVVVWKVVDAIAYRTVSSNPTQHNYEEIQAELRSRVGALSLDELLAERSKLTEGLVDALTPIFRRRGIEVVSAALRDITLAGAAKQAFADLWKAEKDGQAALERARGEQAALRALANAARTLKGNPELMNLRLLQALAGQPGKIAPTVILGGGPGLAPLRPGPVEGTAADAGEDS